MPDTALQGACHIPALCISLWRLFYEQAPFPPSHRHVETLGEPAFKAPVSNIEQQRRKEAEKRRKEVLREQARKAAEERAEEAKKERGESAAEKKKRVEREENVKRT